MSKTNRPITLATLGEATAQEVFDHVAHHLLTQNAQSLNDDNACLYRGPNGLKCAAGCLMTDEEYRPDFEDKTWIRLISDHGVNSNHSDLIRELQNTHDMFDCFDDTWEYRLSLVAKDFNLSTEIFNQFNS